MYRREILRFALATSALSLAACKRPRTRRELMDDLVQRVLVPETKNLVRASAALVASLRALQATESAQTLAAARSQFRDTLLTFERGYALRKGPIVDTNALLRTTFFPARTSAIEELLASDGARDADAVDSLGIDQRGLFALEALLFGETGAAHPERRRAFMVALAENVSSYARKVAAALGDGRALAAAWSADAQLTLSQIVNDMLASVETLAAERVAGVVSMAERQNMVLRNVQGAPSGSSTEIIATWLEGLANLYGTGDQGIGALVANAAPAIDESMRAALSAARAATRALSGPIEHVAQREPARVDTLQRALKKLELTIKVDLASALGITVTFSAADGD